MLVGRVAAGSPAQAAGLERGDIIVGINGEKVATLSELYRKMWALGAAGVTVPLDVKSDDAMRRVEVKSVNRLDTLKLGSTYRLKRCRGYPSPTSGRVAPKGAGWGEASV